MLAGYDVHTVSWNFIMPGKDWKNAKKTVSMASIKTL
jgi:hypothetical protein